MSHKIIGHLGLLAGSVDHSKRSIAARAACSPSQLYTYPVSNTTVDATQPLTFKWNTGCDYGSKIDLYLYQPASTKGLIQGWSGVDYTKGEYQVNLKPSWWNGTETAELYVQMVTSGEPTWSASTGPGPMFKLEYDASLLYSTTTVGGQVETSAKYPAVTNGGDAIMQTVSSTNSNRGISKGAIAAAVIVPILVLAVLAGVAVRFWRLREAEKRRRWSAAVSTHSGLEWEKGARPGEKPASILGRPSTHFSARPHSMATSSVYAVENNMAGTGAGQNFPRPSFGQMRSHSSESVNNRSSVVMPDGNVRQSRISFAENARPDRRSRMSLGDNLRPNIGRLPGGSRSASDLHSTPRKGFNDSAIADDDDEEGIHVSPTQMQGPNAFADADMRRAAGNKTGRRSFMSLGGGDKRRMSTVSAASADDFKSAASARGSVDELRDMEAVMLMRRSMISQYSNKAAAPEDQVEALEHDAHDAMPSPPPAAANPNPIVAYGPDQMLAVYAARGKVSATPMPSLPAPGDMRSYVHLNTGTVSSAAVQGLPAPGPRHGAGSGSGSSASGTLGVPTTRSNARMSGSSEVSTYSEDADVGEAK